MLYVNFKAWENAANINEQIVLSLSFRKILPMYD